MLSDKRILAILAFPFQNRRNRSRARQYTRRMKNPFPHKASHRTRRLRERRIEEFVPRRFPVRMDHGQPEGPAQIKMPYFIGTDAVKTGILSLFKQKIDGSRKMAAAGEWLRQTRLRDDAIASITFPVIPSLGMCHQSKPFNQRLCFHFSLPSSSRHFSRLFWHS